MKTELKDIGLLSILPQYEAWANEAEYKEIFIHHWEDDHVSCDTISVVMEDSFLLGAAYLSVTTSLQIEKWSNEGFYRVRVKKSHWSMVNQKPRTWKVKKISTLLKYLDIGRSSVLTLLEC